MATAPSPVTLEEYLRTSYSPDREYIDGVMQERNVGHGKHAYTQGRIYRKLAEALDASGRFALPEQRVRVSEWRVRVPDACVVAKLQEVVSVPPLLCVEVASPDDTWQCLHASISDYFNMGVICNWIVDPYRRRSWVYDGDNPPQEAHDTALRASHLGIEIALEGVLPPE